MHAHSDIAELFSKLSDDKKQYREIAHTRKQEEAGLRWALLNEIHRSISPTEPGKREESR